MHSVKKYIMPKHVKYVSLNILQFNEKCFFQENSLYYVCWRKNKNLLFSPYRSPKITIFP